jgi:hypothetical protein
MMVDKYRHFSWSGSGLSGRLQRIVGSWRGLQIFVKDSF